MGIKRMKGNAGAWGNQVEGKSQWGQFENPMGFFAEAGDEGL